MQNDLLILGCGSLGHALGERWQDKGRQVTGVRRTPPSTASFPYLAGDITQTQDVKNLPQSRVVLCTFSPSERTPEAYEALYKNALENALNHLSPETWFFVSSTSVYGQSQGEWVNETSETRPSSPTAQLILQAEQTLLARTPQSTIIRFSGIYGPERTYLLKSAQAGKAVQKSPPSYTNRIHEADCVGVLDFLLEKHWAGQPLEKVYLASDDAPCPRWEIMTWLAKQLKAPHPEESQGEAQNKRCSNQRLKALGYRFKYPDYKTGYGEILASMGTV